MAYKNLHCKCFLYKLSGLKKKLEFQLVLLASSSHILLACDNFLLALVNEEGGGDIPGILVGDVPRGSPNADPISDQKYHFPHPFPDLVSKKLYHHYFDLNK